MINEQLSRIPLFGRTRALSLSKDKLIGHQLFRKT